jgi:surface polysaccharide O-acyltransferase-like enzyme
MRSGSRDVWVDHLKAAAIVGVVCIHAGMPHNEFLRFGVPVFVGLWAFYLETSLARIAAPDRPAHLRRRLIELAVPYLAWTCFYIAIFYLNDVHATPWHTIIGGWFGGFGWSGQYFFIVLFQLVVLMPWLRRLATPRTLVPVIVLGVLFNALAEVVLFDYRWVAAISDRLFVYWIPYVFLGIGLARGHLKGTPALVLPALALLALAPREAALLAAQSPYLVVTVTIASLLLMAAAVAADRRARERGLPQRVPNRLERVSTFVGRNTFVVYVANVLMLEVARRIGLMSGADVRVGPVEVIAISILVIAACLGLGVVFQALGLGLLVGKPARVRTRA